MIEDINTTHNQKDIRRNERNIQIYVFVAGLTSVTQLYLFQPILPELTRQFDITPVTSSLVVSMSTVGMVAGLFLGAFMADRITRKKVMSIALIVSSILTILSALMPAFFLLVILNTIKGFFLSGISSVTLAYIAEEVRPAKTGRVMSIYLSSNIAGGMIGRVLGALLTGWLTWQWMTVIIGGVCLIFSLLLAWNLPVSRHFQPYHISLKEKLRQMGVYLKTPLLIVMYLTAAIMMGSFVSVYNYVGFVLEEDPYHLPHYLIASIFLMYVFGAIGTVLAGELGRKYSLKLILLGALGLIVLSMLLLLPDQLLWIVTGVGILTFSFFAAHTIASRIVAQYDPQGRSTTTSTYWLFYYAGSSLLGTTTGVLMTRFGWDIFVLCLACAMGMVLVLASRIKVAQRTANV